MGSMKNVTEVILEYEREQRRRRNEELRRRLESRTADEAFLSFCAAGGFRKKERVNAG